MRHGVPAVPPGTLTRPSGDRGQVVGDSRLDRVARLAIAVLLGGTGFAALVNQTVWQRMVALYSGVDLSSATVVVAAFLTGLAVGSEIGGRISRSMDCPTAVRALGWSAAAGAACTTASPWIFSDLNRAVVGALDATLPLLALNFVLLVPIAALFGLTLPFGVRAISARNGPTGRPVGWLSAANTMGAALGAATAGWVLLGTRGMVGSLRVAAAVQAAVAVSCFGLAAARRRRRGHRPPGQTTEIPALIDPLDAGAPISGRLSGRSWYFAYAATGAVAVGFEQVCFRLVDGVMRSNAYTFAHVLSLYLALLAIGSALGAWALPRVQNPRRVFVRLQLAIALSAAATLALLSALSGLGPLNRWFNSDGFAAGFADVATGQLVLFGFVLPLWIMGPPVMLMGAAFPIVHTIVTTERGAAAHTAGALLRANLLGNVAGALITSFVLIEQLGTAGTYRVLILGAAGVSLVAEHRMRVATTRTTAIRALGIIGVVVLLVPSNHRLWAGLHGTTTGAILVAEDRSCASAIEVYGDRQFQLTINGAGQNGYPFDDFHVLVGLLPVLAHPDPRSTLAIGLGIGSTSYAMLASRRTQEVVSVELCDGNSVLLDRLAARGVPELEQLRDDDRHREIHGDGRRHLLATDRSYEVIVPDTLRPNSAGAGNLYSLEFQQAVRDRLTPDGITAGWVPTYRALNSVSVTFPHVVLIDLSSYNGSTLYLASGQPLDLDPAVMVERFDELGTRTLPADQRTRLRNLLAGLDPDCVNDGHLPPTPTEDRLNRDLWPRDEYFLANGGIAEEQVARTC